MQELAHVTFRSQFVSICDVCCPTAFGGCDYPLECGSLVFVRSGFFTARLGARSIVIDPNYAMRSGKGDSLRAMPSSKTSCTFTSIRCLEEGTASTSSHTVSLCGSTTYLNHARLLNQARLASSDAAINEAAATLLSETTGAHYEPSHDVSRAQIVSEIKTLLNQSVAKRITLFELANRFYLSPFTISRWFHWETGVPLRRYVQRLRLRRALTFMLDEKRSLTAIALELGFYDEAHFSKAFHAEFGTPPALALRAYADTPLNPPFAEPSIPD